MVAQRQALTPFTLTSRVAFSPSAGSMRGVLLLMCFAGILEELTEFTAAQPTYSKPTAGNLKIAVTDAAIAPVVPMFLKLLTNVVGNIKVPQQELSGVKLEEMQVHDIQFGNMSIKMVGNELLVSLWNITAAVPEARFDYDLFLISCSGKARTDVRDANASLKLMLSIGDDNLPIVTVEDMVVRFLNLAIVPTLEGWCKPADIIANILMKIFERGIVDYLQKHVPVVIEPLVKTLMVDTIRRLPITIVNPPNISDGRMELLLVINPDLPTEGTSTVTDTAELSAPLPERDVAIVCSFAAANNILRLVHRLVNSKALEPFIDIPEIYNSSLAETVYPNVFKLCPNCSLRIVAVLDSAPWLDMEGEEGFVISVGNVTLRLNMLLEGGSSINIMSTTLEAVANVTHLALMENSRADVQLASISVVLDTLTLMNRAPDLTKINGDIRALLNKIIIPVINKHERGVQSPFNLHDPLLLVSNGTYSFGLNAMAEYPLLSSLN